MAVAKIVVGHRYRQSLGNIAELARSIQTIGLLQPLVVTVGGELIAGRRRLEAVRELKWERVQVRFVSGAEDALKLLRAERDENTCRKDFTPSEAVAIGKAIEQLEAKEAKLRKAQAKGQPRGIKKDAKDGSSGKLPPETGKTRDRVGEAVGLSGKSYTKAKAVCAAAEESPEQFGAIKEEMDKSGRIDPAHKKVQKLLRDKCPAEWKRGPDETATAWLDRLQHVTVGDQKDFRKEFKSLLQSAKSLVRKESKQQAQDAQKKTGDQPAERGQPTAGMILAIQARGLLRQIPADDPMRKQGLQLVADWLKENQ
jgi:ParB-like chromosome segregation protein Spo0J